MAVELSSKLKAPDSSVIQVFPELSYVPIVTPASGVPVLDFTIPEMLHPKEGALSDKPSTATLQAMLHRLKLSIEAPFLHFTHPKPHAPYDEI